MTTSPADDTPHPVQTEPLPIATDVYFEQLNATYGPFPPYATVLIRFDLCGHGAVGQAGHSVVPREYADAVMNGFGPEVEI